VTYVLYGVLICLIVYQSITHYLTLKRIEAHHCMLVEDWMHERKDLINRIQARDYGEYKQAEIRVIKAQKDEPPKPKLEML
jgi:hypothetical protein